MADVRRIESELETIRQAHYAAGDKVNQAQGSLYEANAEVGKLEAEIRFVVEGRQRAQSRLEQLTAQRQMWGDNRTASEAELAQMSSAAESLAEQQAILEARAQEANDQLP